VGEEINLDRWRSEALSRGVYDPSRASSFCFRFLSMRLCWYFQLMYMARVTPRYFVAWFWAILLLS